MNLKKLISIGVLTVTSIWMGGAIQAADITKVISVSAATGTLSVSSGATSNYNCRWRSTDTDPQLDITTGGLRNNMTYKTAAGTLGPYLICYPGTVEAGKTYSFQVTNDFFVSHVKLVFTTETPATPATVTMGGTTLTCTAQAQTLEADFTEEDPAKFVMGGSNTGAVMSTFEVTVTKRAASNLPEPKIISKYDGTDDYPVVYRIPAVATVPAGPKAGRIIGFADYRYSKADIGYGRIDLYQTYSDDNGQTWSTPDVMRGADGNPVAQGDASDGFSCGYGDAAVVADRTSGKLLLLSCAGKVPFFTSRRATPIPTARWYSEDGGATWTPVEDVTESIYSLFDGEATYGCIDGHFIGSGRIHQSRYCKVGNYYRLYMAIDSQNEGGNTRNWVLYSDDFGQSWKVLGGTAAAPIIGSGDESKVEELPNGDILIAGRNRYGNRNFNIFHFTNNWKAEGSWDTNTTSQLGMPNTINACNGEIIMVPAIKKADNTKCLIAIQSIPFGPGRTNVGLVWKALDGVAKFQTPEQFAANWDGTLQLSKINSCYSVLTIQPDGKIGAMYEESTFGADYSIIYRSLPLELITDDQYSYVADPNNEIGKEFPSSVESIATTPAEVKWYDIFGRQATKFVKGQIYIGSDGTKMIAK